MPDPVKTLSDLPSLERYSKKDLYHDFRRTFMGTDEGRRVLRQILDWGHMLKPGIAGNPIDPYGMAVQNGERNLALKIFSAVHNEPPEHSGKQKR